MGDYSDIMERLALIIELAEPLTSTPDDNSILATRIQQLAMWEKTPEQVRKELGPEWSK
jgi:hypothetical protein